MSDFITRSIADTQSEFFEIVPDILSIMSVSSNANTMPLVNESEDKASVLEDSEDITDVDKVNTLLSNPQTKQSDHVLLKIDEKSQQNLKNISKLDDNNQNIINDAQSLVSSPMKQQNTKKSSLTIGDEFAAQSPSKKEGLFKDGFTSSTVMDIESPLSSVLSSSIKTQEIINDAQRLVPSSMKQQNVKQSPLTKRDEFAVQSSSRREKLFNNDFTSSTMMDIEPPLSSVPSSSMETQKIINDTQPLVPSVMKPQNTKKSSLTIGDEFTAQSSSKKEGLFNNDFASSTVMDIEPPLSSVPSSSIKTQKIINDAQPLVPSVMKPQNAKKSSLTTGDEFTAQSRSNSTVTDIEPPLLANKNIIHNKMKKPISNLQASQPVMKHYTDLLQKVFAKLEDNEDTDELSKNNVNNNTKKSDNLVKVSGNRMSNKNKVHSSLIEQHDHQSLSADNNITDKRRSEKNIKIKIGRLEVQANTKAPKATMPTARVSAPAILPSLSLTEYLQRRNRG